MQRKPLNPTKYETLADYPAYSIHAPVIWAAYNAPVLRHGEDIMIRYNGRWTQFSPGSVAGYAIECDDDPVEAIDRARERGHEMKWINSCAVSLTSHKRAKAAYFGLELGTPVYFEGEYFTLEKDWNNNVKLVPTERPA